ncbi:hypothetical protein Tco_0807230 [Tanacetum coccineum]
MMKEIGREPEVKKVVNTDLDSQSPLQKLLSQTSHSNDVRGSWRSAVKTSASYNWRNSRPNFNYNSGPTFIRTVNANGPQGRPNPVKAWMPDENQILLKVPRHHNMYSFDMKTPTPAKGFACLIAKATSDESKLWHRRLGVGYRWMFDIDYLTDSMNYIPVSLENQANPHAGTSEKTNNAYLTDSMNYIPVSLENQANPHAGASKVTNSAGTSQTPNSNASEEKEEILTESQQEKKASSTDTSEDNPKILAFRRELEEIALKHLGTVSKNNSTSTPSVNTGNESVNTGRLDPDDSPMLELEIFHKSETGFFDEAFYDEEGVITDFNSLPTEIEVSPTLTLRIHNIHPKNQILGDPKSAVQTRSKVQQKSGAHALFSFIQK